MTSTQTKVPVSTIAVLWTEGGDTPAPFTTFAAFDAWARVIGCPAPDSMCYYKTKITITWADGHTFTGRVDLDSACMASSANILTDHLTGYMDWQSAHGGAAEAMATKALYQIADEGAEPSDAPGNDNASTTSALLAAFEAGEEARRQAGMKAENARLTALALTHYVGPKYDRDRPARETAKLIRKELSAAGKAKTGPLAGCACRVTTSRVTRSMSIDVEIASIPARGMPVVNPARVEADEAGHRATPSPLLPLLSKRGTAMVAAVEAIVAAYNYDKSDTMTDYYSVAFYSDVRIASAIQESERAEIRGTLAMLKQA